MSKNQNPISIENANSIAAHLKAILDNEQAPQTLKRDISEAVNNLFNTNGTDTDAISDSFFNIRSTLLAHGGNGAAIAELEADAAPKPNTRWEQAVEEAKRVIEHKEDYVYAEPESRVSDLPELISRVLNHPHVTNGIYDALSEALSETVEGGGDSPEFVAATLGLKIKESAKTILIADIYSDYKDETELLQEILFQSYANQADQQYSIASNLLRFVALLEDHVNVPLALEQLSTWIYYWTEEFQTSLDKAKEGTDDAAIRRKELGVNASSGPKGEVAAA